MFAGKARALNYPKGNNAKAHAGLRSTLLLEGQSRVSPLLN